MSVESVIAIVGDRYLVREHLTGQLITRWERCENLMSKISSTTLDTAVYLYSSKEDAENCIDAGGSGFLVGISDGVKPGGWVYAVTNQHVIEEGYKTVRLLYRRVEGHSSAEGMDLSSRPQNGFEHCVPWCRKSQDFQLSHIYAQLAFHRQNSIDRLRGRRRR